MFKTTFTANVLDGSLSLMKSLSLTTQSPFPSIFFGLGPLLKTPITAVVLDGFLLLIKGSSSTAWSPFPSVFFGLGVTIEAAKPDCVLPIGDNDPSYKNCSSGELIVMKNQWNTAFMEASVVSIMQTPAIPLWFPKKWLLLRISFLFSIDRQIYSHDHFSKILTTFCASRNWWIIVVFLQGNRLRITILSQEFTSNRFSKISRIFYEGTKSWIIIVFLQCTK